MTKMKRHFFACYSVHGENHIVDKQIADVIAFTCPLTRNNWVELMNKYARSGNKGRIAIKVNALFVRKIMTFDRICEIKFTPVTPDSRFFVPELYDQTYFFTEVNK